MKAKINKLCEPLDFGKTIFLPKGAIVEVVGTPTKNNQICIRYKGINTMIDIKYLEGIENEDE